MQKGCRPADRPTATSVHEMKYERYNNVVIVVSGRLAKAAAAAAASTKRALAAPLYVVHT